ncbi:MAG: flagellar type III secretion system pore protein FliP [Acidimicrobiales bacterium]
MQVVNLNKTKFLLVLGLAFGLVIGLDATPVSAQTTPAATIPTPVLGDNQPVANPDASLTLDLGDVKTKPSQSVLIILLLTLLSVAPSLLIMLTSFTRIIIVFSLTRNALGLQGIPPNQVLIGLSLFLSLFIMAPTFKELNDKALQPLLDGTKTQSQAYEAAVPPLRKFMMKQTNESELATFVAAASDKRPDTPEDISMTSLVPAFILSEIKAAFIIGFIIFIPFLVIDIVVSTSLMSMGMMMLPPMLVALPFKLMLFVMVDGWDLIVRSLLTSFK